MNIEKVSNGYVVETPIELPDAFLTESTASMQCGTKKSVCPDLMQLLNFINAHYGNEEARSVVMKDA